MLPIHELRAARRYAILEAPSILGLRPTGVERMPERLLELGFGERITARAAGRVEPPPYQPGLDPATGVANALAIAAWSPTLATAIEAVLDLGEVPVILGGDCSILLGSMLALRRRGRYGLLFLDGHADYFQPHADPSGEAASMELGFVTGVGPAQLTDLEGRWPLVRFEDTVAMAFRDGDEQVKFGSQSLPPELRAYDLDSVRRLGARAAAEAALEHVTRPELDGFFVHIDADCLDDDIMPAVDYRTMGGLSWKEFGTILEVILASGKVVGLEVTIYNPDLDIDESAGQGLVDALVAALGPR
jgi:arginase